jgi:hypothetical protein
LSTPDEAPTADENVNGNELLGAGDEDGEGDVDEEHHVTSAASAVDNTSNLNHGKDITMTGSQTTEQPELNGTALEGSSGMSYITPACPDNDSDSP